MGQVALGFGDGALQDPFARFDQVLRRGAFVDDVEVGGHARFDGKASDQAFAKGMDGADLQAARHVEDAGE